MIRNLQQSVKRKFLISSEGKDLLGMGVGLSSRPSQYVQVQLQGERENKHMACSALRVGGSSESIWEELYHQGVGNGQFPSLIAQTLIQYFQFLFHTACSRPFLGWRALNVSQYSANQVLYISSAVNSRRARPSAHCFISLSYMIKTYD